MSQLDGSKAVGEAQDNPLADAAAAAGQEDGAEDAQPKPRGGFLRVLIVLLLSGGLGGGGYFAVSAGFIPGPMAVVDQLLAPPPPSAWPDGEPPSYVTLPTLTISLGAQAQARHLRVAATLEVAPGMEEVVEQAAPRIVAGLTRFLRAVDERDFEKPAMMVRLQEQMLRRAEFNAPPGALRDLLLQEFILN
ncbi:MAG: flagellar basal body-associated FliL family protein [Pseudomonadota bacterium]